MKALIDSKKVDKYPYMTLGQVKKEYDAKHLPAPTKIFSTVDKPDPGFLKAMANPKSPMRKAMQAGRDTHHALETGVIKNDLVKYAMDEFSKNILPRIDEVWGMESGVYHPDGYVGKFDAVGVIEGKTALWDYKKVNRRKTKSQMKKYFMQSIAYVDAHDWMFDTNLEQISILQIYGKTKEEMGSEIVTLDADDINEARNSFRDYLRRYNEII
tara:strand:- start:830 stop:1468 length:639 start_codon:yes stop_codon:yes gene_type:complete